MLTHKIKVYCVIPAGWIDSECETNRQCAESMSNAACVEGKCVCLDGTKLNGDHRVCVRG